MAVRYDACIIGAGADGLAAAAVLAARGRRVVVLERLAAPGGRCVTRAIAPGYFASPFADELPAIPPTFFREFDLCRRGVVMMPAGDGGALAAVRQAVIARAMADAERVPPRFRFRHPTPPPWPGEDLATRAGPECGGEPARADLAMLAGPPGGLVRGGLGALGAALATAAIDSGAEIACEREVTGLRRRRGRVVAVECADGSEVAARAVISTLDVKHTFLTLFPWSELPAAVVERIGAFRPAPGVARLLLALESPPEVKDPSVLRRPIALAADGAAALTAWSGGIIPEHPPTTLRLVTAVDPLLAPAGGAVLTVTLDAIPHTPFDGPWDGTKRRLLLTRALTAVEAVLPGTVAKIKAAELLLPPDIESALGLTDGDLCGGALAPSQMLSFRPFPECSGTRTPLAGLYLAGPSSTLGSLATCASGIAAATAVLADLGAGRL